MTPHFITVFQELNSYADHAEANVIEAYPNTVANLRNWREKLRDEYFNPQNTQEGLKYVLDQLEEFIKNVDAQK